MEPAPLSFGARLVLAWVCYFQLLFDGVFAAKVQALRNGQLLLPPSTPEPKPAPAKQPSERPAPSAPKVTAAPTEPDQRAALQLLSLLQQEGRLVDFLMQEVASFADADIGAAARVVHEGCRKTLARHAKLRPVKSESEGTTITVAEGFDPSAVKLIGNVQGKAPYRGVLRHRGWRVESLELPTTFGTPDLSVVAAAEVEL